MITNRREKQDPFIYRIEPTVKLLIFFYLIITLYLVGGIYENLIILCLILIVARIAELPLLRLFRGIYIFIAVAIFTHLFFTPGRPILFSNQAFINLTEEGLREGIFISFRITNMFLAASVLTLTTPPERLIYGLNRIFTLFERVGLPVQRFSFMIALSLRFLPMLIMEINQTVDLGLNHILRNNKNTDKTTKFSQRIGDMIPALSGLFVRMFTIADEIIATGDLPHPLEKKRLGTIDKFAMAGISALFIIGWAMLILK